MRRRLATVAAVSVVLVAAPAHAADPIEDETPPFLTITPMAGAVDGWYADTATVFAKASDLGPDASGVSSLGWRMSGASTGTGTLNRTSGGTLTVSNGGLTTIDFEAVDNAGNEAQGQVQIGIDRVLPSVEFIGRINGADPMFAHGEEELLTFRCVDSLSGVGSCSGTQATGALLDTSTIGTHSVTVTARDRVGNQAQVTRSYRVVSNQFDVTQMPDVDGMKTVGQQVTVRPPVFDPAPTTVSYQWMRNDIAIPGATGTTYTLTPDDARTTLRVRATAARSAWQSRTVVSPGYVVAPASISMTSPPVLTGEASVNGSLAVSHGQILPAAANVSYQWVRDGVLIPGASGSTYFPDYRDIGTRISVRVSATAPGYAEGVWLSAPSEAVRGRSLEVTGAPIVSGVMRAGSVLTAQPPTVRVPPLSRPGDPATVAYQWLRGGTPIAGATQSTYRLSPEDVGRQVTVRITATRPPAEGYEPVVRTSAPGPAVAKATPAVTGKAKAKRDRKVKLTVTVAVPGLDPSAPVIVKRGSKVVARGAVTGSGRLVLTLKRQPKGKVSWTVLYAGSSAIEARTIRVSAKVR